jgi:enoyl-CoA hydratase/carnithine racemase
VSEPAGEGLRVEDRGPARVLWIARPEVRNAVDTAVFRALVREGRRATNDATVRAIVLAGEGTHFAAGADLREWGPRASAAAARSLAKLGRQALEALRSAGVPLIAAVEGDALGGGCELATACDLRILSEGARLHWVHGSMAVTTAWGTAERLVRLVGPSRATRWLLLGERVDAAEAREAGLADAVVPAGGCVDAACAWAERVARIDRGASSAQLRLLRRAGLRDAALREELAAFVRCWSSPAHRDAARAAMKRLGIAHD